MTLYIEENLTRTIEERGSELWSTGRIGCTRDSGKRISVQARAMRDTVTAILTRVISYRGKLTEKVSIRGPTEKSTTANGQKE